MRLSSSTMVLARVTLFALLASSLSGQEWRRRTPATSPTGPAFSMVYDAARERIVLLGIRDAPNVWEWDGDDWRMIPASSGPGGDGALAYDSSRGRILCYAWGSASTWQWDGARWTQLFPEASPPPSRGLSAAMTFDGSRGVAVLHVNPSLFPPDPAQGTWEWDGLRWRQVASGAANYLGLAYDSIRRVVVTVGSGTHEWEGGSWVQKSVEGGSSPVAFDASLGEVVTGTGSLSPGVRSWNGSRWQTITTAQGPVLVGHVPIAHDAKRHRTVSFGGPLNPGETWEFIAFPATYAAFGAGCAGSHGKVPRLEPAAGSLPLIGNLFRVRLTDLPPSGTALMVLGLSKSDWFGIPLPLPLDFIGMIGCVNYIDHVRSFPVVNAGGTAVWSMVVPYNPGLCFYNQAFAVDPSANPFELIVSNAGEGMIGF
jgi:hypothetical protein